jgi:hypothetical protein
MQPCERWLASPMSDSSSTLEAEVLEHRGYQIRLTHVGLECFIVVGGGAAPPPPPDPDHGSWS